MTPETTPEDAPASVARRSRWLRRAVWIFGISVLVLMLLLVGVYFYASSARFEDNVRRRVIAALEDATGGRVEIGAFHWNLLHLRVEATNITIHGLEAANEDPYAHVDRLALQVSVLNLLTIGTPTHVILREAEIVRPQFHLIVYPNGTTNQPHPKHETKSSKPAVDTLFDARIGTLHVEQGTLHIADKVTPLDLQAHDADVKLTWVPAGAIAGGRAENYRILVSLGDLAFAQGKFKPVPSSVEAAVTLFRDSAELEWLRLAALDRTLNLRGKLTSFAHPAWQAQADGQVDVRMLAPFAGVVYTRSGVVNLKATVSGKGGEFQGSGEISSDAIHYQDPVVDAQTGSFYASFKADTKQLLVSGIRTRLARGGEVDGEFQYDNWLESTPKPAERRALEREHKSWPVPTGTVRGDLKGISLDTMLVLLATPRYRHLGLDMIVSGPATASWTGLADDLQVGGQLALNPSAKSPTGEVPATGSVDATYRVDSGSVKVRTLDVRLPHSSVEGKGSLGVYPISRSSEMDLDFQSSDLSEFDGVLRALNLKHGTRAGAAALPVQLKGQAQFHGHLNSSWLTPRIEGRLTATSIGIEVPSSSTGPNAALQFINWDSVDLDALYTPANIVVHHGVLKRGAASITFEGHLDADDPTYNLSRSSPAFDGNSDVSLRASVQQFPMGQLLPLVGVSAPISGDVNAKVDVQGHLNALVGSGSLDVAKATVYGEAVEQLHVAASMSGQQLKIASLSAQQGGSPNGGRLSGTGSYDLAHHNFQIDARGSAIDLGSISRIKATGLGIAGQLGFSVIGDGTLNDPHLQAHATLSKMQVSGEPVRDIQISASSRQQTVIYDLSSQQPAGKVNAHGETKLDADYSTQASLEFSNFDIGTLLKLLKVTGINGQSDLEGTAKISGPLAHPEKLSGEASLKDLAVVIEGVHLQSKGAVHAALAKGVAKLDPVEITGEDTDLKLRGTLAVTGSKQLDLQASGSVNMRLAETLDKDLVASGVTSFQMEAHGPLANPILQGKVEFQNAALALQDFPNGLSQIKGTLEFIQNRLEVRSLTAMSGGGQLSVGGYLGFQKGLYADLTATGKSIRIRYPQGISSLADATLRLQGPQNNLLLSGNVVVTRFAINSDLDISSFASSSGAVQAIVSPDAPSNHLRLDIHLTSAPQLNFQNALAKLAGDVDLHIRGTLASPSVLGRISLSEGNATFGGTKYELQRGDIYFNNPVRIQPNIDLDATARVEDYDITLGLHGTTDKYNLTYRSEPPLPEADVIALLALGRTQDEQRAYSQQQQQAGDNPMTDALLGGALNATVSNRVQRLFGTGAIKVDPNFIGSLGNSTARVTVVEQIGKNLTFTYASNVNTTTQQLIQAEVAINRHVSLLVTQDESGIFSVVVKARRRYK
jgi:translocation and assembly module TamB